MSKSMIRRILMEKNPGAIHEVDRWSGGTAVIK